MRIATLEILRCPFCGTRPQLVEHSMVVRSAESIDWGVLGCECCAFPVVDGIPVMMATDAARTAIRQIEAGHRDDALHGLLGLDGPRANAFGRLMQRPEAVTYRAALEVLSVDAEGQYFIYRFSDPTFLVTEALIRALGQHRQLTHRTLDVCGGTGHVTRVLAMLSAPVGETLLVDLYFWKLWLAKRFTAPTCEPMCADANQPLPFASGVFGLVVCSDAFPYIWQKRLLANEMMRLTAADGAVVLPHLHSAHGENFTAGMPLSPEAYASLFAPLGPRFFRDSVLLSDVVEQSTLDLSRHVAATDVGDEPALAVIASAATDLFTTYATTLAPVGGDILVNPLYAVERRGDQLELTLTFPTPEYEEEFAAVKRYLPDRVTLHVAEARPLTPDSVGPDYAELRRRRVLLDMPTRYC